MTEQSQHHATWPVGPAAARNAGPWREVRAARPVSVPPGTPDAPLHRPHRQADEARKISAHIERYFPGIRCWWGRHTHLWWAYLPTPQGGCLLNATDPHNLIAQISQISRGPQGRWWSAGR